MDSDNGVAVIFFPNAVTCKKVSWKILLIFSFSPTCE